MLRYLKAQEKKTIDLSPCPSSSSIDPFAKTVPDHVDSVLTFGVEDATVCNFDKRGTYLAAGYATGAVVIWDFITRQAEFLYSFLPLCYFLCPHK